MLYFKTVLKDDKEIKNLAIYNIIKQKGQVSRSDIANQTKINIVSISNYINTFIKKGLILEKEIGESSGGRPPIILDLNKDNFYTIGLHISDSTILGLLINSAIEIKNKSKKKLDFSNPEQSIINMIQTLIKNENDKIKGIGIVVENEASKIDNKEIAKLEKIIKEQFQINLYIDKPSISAAYAELLSGIFSPGVKTLFSYSDIGDCVYLEDHNIYTWENKDKESFSYLRPWNINMSIKNYTKKIIEKGIGTEIIHLAAGSINNITDTEILEAAKKNDNVAIEILEFVGLNLGVRLSYLVNALRPKKLILAGGMYESDKYFIEPLKKSIEKLAEQDALKELEIINSELGEDAVAMGAAALITREIFIGA